ncbi:hypothetical protein SKAU_G00053440 [Synaphobranchus kaupii]|uniref:Uncharacterized protein n=1 Tax=Synaphobranchus kaupii TaxID=118154 RepID=A0A9Q1G3G5_SYNKA|nr:hypothetical protein SKAU_G00053440 [Synaphobranchus kaupii]
MQTCNVSEEAQPAERKLESQGCRCGNAGFLYSLLWPLMPPDKEKGEWCWRHAEGLSSEDCLAGCDVGEDKLFFVENVLSAKLSQLVLQLLSGNT